MKWHFIDHPKGVDKQGIRDGDIETFDRFRYSSVVRESIQNSLDVVKDESKPVKVVFEFFAINKNKFKELFSIYHHLRACKDWSDNEADVDLINSMIRHFEKSNDSIEVLKITDSNTLGMNQKTLEVFSEGRNISDKKNSDSAGSKGMGKAAYFCLSYLRTILVSSLYSEDNSFISIGISRLSNHTIKGNTKYYKGIFSDEKSSDPVKDPNLVNELFKPIEKGTSISIIGLWTDQNRLVKMQESIFDNFWFAINNNNLEIEIIDSINKYTKKINSSTLRKDIDKIWNSNEESNQFRVKPNPRAYYQVITDLSNSNRKTYEKKIPDFGSVNLVLSRGDKFPGRIAFFRKTKMLIFKDTKGLDKGSCGVFYCDDSNGNTILKNLENARHDEWNSSNWSVNKTFGRKIMKDINTFIQECIVDFRGNDQVEEMSIPNLSEYISLDFGEKTKKLGNYKPLIVRASVKPKKDPNAVYRNHTNIIVQSYVTSDMTKTLHTYHVLIEAKQEITNKIWFEILVGSDNERNSDDVKIPIKGANKKNGQSLEFIKNNFLIERIEKGKNHFSFILDDTFKHSLIIRPI